MKTRGQSMVLLSLMLLLLVVMVCMTLSIGSKARTRIELQTLADTSAYSNAVATARTFNTASLLNRTMVSQWSAMCGIAVLHSWGSSQSAYFNSFRGLVMELNTPNEAYVWGGTAANNQDWEEGTCRDGNGF